MRAAAAFLALALVGRVMAQPAPSGAGVLDAARAHYLAGRAYYAAGDFRRALGEFIAARGDADRPELDYNIGLVYEGLGDAARAVAAYERFLSRRPRRQEDASLDQRLVALRTRVGALTIETHVAGTTITVDGEPVDPVAARQEIATTVGAHRVVAAREGMFSHGETVQVWAGRTTRVAIDPDAHARRRLPGWAIALITTGSVLLVGGAVTGGVLGARAAGPGGYSGNVAPGLVSIHP